MTDDEHGRLGRRTFLGGMGAAAVGSAMPVTAPIPTALAQNTDSAVENIAAMRDFWQARMGTALPKGILRSVTREETTRMTERLAAQTGYQWDSIQEFFHQITRLEKTLQVETKPSDFGWRNQYDASMQELVKSLLLVETLAKDSQFMQACQHAATELKQVDEELGAADFPSLSWFCPEAFSTSENSLEQLLQRVHHHIDTHLAASTYHDDSDLWERMTLWERTVRQDYPHPPVTRAVVMQSGLYAFMGRADGLDQFHIDCPMGTVGSLRITPCRHGEEHVPDEKQLNVQDDLARKHLDAMSLDAARQYLIRNPVDLEQIDFRKKCHVAQDLGITSYNGDEDLSAQIAATDPLLYKSRAITPKKREAVASSMEWGSSLVTQAANLVDLLARLNLPEPMAVERKTPGTKVTPGRRLALEHVRNLEPQGVIIDNDTGQIIIEDAPLAQAVQERQEELESTLQGDRVMAHAEQQSVQTLAR